MNIHVYWIVMLSW